MKVLVIQPKMIGDVLTTSILFESLRTEHPKANLVYGINAGSMPVVENNPFIDDYIVLDKNEDGSQRSLIDAIKFIRKQKFDILIDAYGKLSTNLISLFSSTSKRISKYKYYTFFVYSHPILYYAHPKTRAGLAIENRLQLLKPLGIDVPTPIRPKIYLTQKEKEEALKQFNTFKIDLNKPTFMISALGSNELKTYPLNYMSMVIDQVVKETGGTILLNYIPNQADEIKKLVDLCQEETRNNIIIDLYGKSIRNFLALTSFCSALIGNEGGAVNMAKALGIPTFTIFSPWIDKSTWSIFEGDENQSVHLIDYEHSIYKDCDVSDFKKDALTLYHRFNPDYFSDKLSKFLMRFKPEKNA